MVMMYVLNQIIEVHTQILQEATGICAYMKEVVTNALPILRPYFGTGLVITWMCPEFLPLHL